MYVFILTLAGLGFVCLLRLNPSFQRFFVLPHSFQGDEKSRRTKT